MGQIRGRVAGRAVEYDQAIGRITAIDDQRRAYVRFPGFRAPKLARSALDRGPADEPVENLVGATVLLHFEDRDPERPIIIGIVRDEVRPPDGTVRLQLGGATSRDIRVDGRTLVLEAHEEVQIRCGKSLIALQRDGKILIRGAHVVSRASGPNKLKGGSISLN